MPERLERRLNVLETKSRGKGPPLLVFRARLDGDYERWRSKNVAPLEAEGFYRLVVIVRYLCGEASPA